jgi:hypothetical protein
LTKIGGRDEEKKEKEEEGRVFNEVKEVRRSK